MASNSPASVRQALATARVEIESELCKGCYLCVTACPRKVLERSQELNSRGYYYVYYAGEDCTGCGLCFYSCPEPGAITVYRRGRSK